MHTFAKHIPTCLRVALLLLCAVQVRAQNLVPNPGFEAYTACPAFLADIGKCVAWGSSNYQGSTDYFNACNVYVPGVTQNVGVPGNFMANLPAYEGNGYAGIWLTSNTSANYREYLQNTLTTPMLPGMRYRISFQAAFTQPISNSNILGMHLSVNQPLWFDTSYAYTFLLPLAATINPPMTAAAPASWVLWQSDYVASGGERYFVVGNFHTDSASTGLPTTGFNHSVYMFMDAASVVLVGDDVSVCAGDSITLTVQGGPGYTWVKATDTTHTVLSTASTLTVSPTVTTSYIGYGASDTAVYNVYVTPKPSVTLGADTAFCETGSLQLTAQGTTLPGTQYTWHNGTSGTHFTPTQTGTYWVQADLSGCTATDSIHVTVDTAVSVSLGPDVHLCQGDSLLLQATASAAGLLPVWQDQSTGASLPVYAGGTYSVTVTQGTCKAADSIVVTEDPLPVLSLGNDTAFCGTGSLLLDASFAGATYLWSTGGTTATLTVTATGSYGVKVTLGNCSVSDSVQVAFLQPLQISLGPDTALCAGETLMLDVQAPGWQYLWSDGSAASTFTVSAPGSYGVQVTDANGCQASDDIGISYVDAPQVSFADTVLCDGKVWTLNITNPQATYLWSDKTTDAQTTITGPGTYWGMATNVCGTVADTMDVQYRSCDCRLYIPAGFTPNADGTNEHFGAIPVAGCELTEYAFGIYDRWGGLIYQTANPEQPWDGRLSGQICPNGVYAYRVTYRFKGDARTLEQGSVLLLR